MTLDPRCPAANTWLVQQWHAADARTRGFDDERVRELARQHCVGCERCTQYAILAETTSRWRAFADDFLSGDPERLRAHLPEWMRGVEMSPAEVVAETRPERRHADRRTTTRRNGGDRRAPDREHQPSSWIVAGFHVEGCGHSWELHVGGRCNGLSGNDHDGWRRCECTGATPP